MHRSSLLTPIFLCAACIIAPPVVLPVDTTASVEQTYECALRGLNELNYTITAADRASGFVRARRLQSHILGTDSEYDQQTVSVYRAEDGRTQLRVVPASAGGHDEIAGPSDVGTKDQKALVARCAVQAR